MNYQCFKRFIVVIFKGRLLPIWQDKVTVVLVVIKGKRGVAVSVVYKEILQFAEFAQVFRDEHQGSECSLETFLYRLMKRKEVDKIFSKCENNIGNISCFNDLQLLRRTLLFQVKYN